MFDKINTAGATNDGHLKNVVQKLVILINVIYMHIHIQGSQIQIDNFLTVNPKFSRLSDCQILLLSEPFCASKLYSYIHP